MASSPPPKDRVCGGCTACCRVPDIDTPELKKPAGVWCQHCDIGVGCRIYESRPFVCRPFKCQWLMGLGTDEQRPDKVGVVVDFLREGDDGLAVSTLQIFECEEGRIEQPFVLELTDTALKRNVLVAYRFLSGQNALFVPEAIRHKLGM